MSYWLPPHGAECIVGDTPVVVAEAVGSVDRLDRAIESSSFYGDACLGTSD